MSSFVLSWGHASEAGVRSENQDFVLLPPAASAEPSEGQGFMAILCDGVGGQTGGRQAAEVAARMAHDSYYQSASSHPIAYRLARAIAEAHAAVCDAAERSPGASKMATTIVLALVVDATLYVAAVGDSRAYLWRSGEFEQITTDHNWAAELVRSGQMTMAQARESAAVSVITRSLGSGTNHAPDLRSVPVQAGDRIVMCSDGVHGALDASAIARLVARHAKPKAIARALATAALEAGSRDNVTAAVIALDAPSRERPSAWPRIFSHTAVWLLGMACAGALWMLQSAGLLAGAERRLLTLMPHEASAHDPSPTIVRVIQTKSPTAQLGVAATHTPGRPQIPQTNTPGPSHTPAPIKPKASATLVPTLVTVQAEMPAPDPTVSTTATLTPTVTSEPSATPVPPTALPRENTRD